jgi:AcrR family transcriptional regulator
MRRGHGEDIAMSAKPGVVAGPGELRRSLPRGRHGIAPEVVAANQRARLLWATALEIYERGYGGLTVTDIAARAGVSRQTFYECFESTLECTLAAQEIALGRLRELIGGAYQAERSWAEGVAAAVAAVLSFAAAAPEEANLVRISSAVGGEPELSRRGQEAIEELAAAMREGSGGPSPLGLALREQAVIGGASAVIGAKLVAGEAASLPDLRTELVWLILAPYLGEEEAKKIAAAA